MLTIGENDNPQKSERSWWRKNVEPNPRPISPITPNSPTSPGSTEGGPSDTKIYSFKLEPRKRKLLSLNNVFPPPERIRWTKTKPNPTPEEVYRGAIIVSWDQTIDSKRKPPQMPHQVNDKPLQTSNRNLSSSADFPNSPKSKQYNPEGGRKTEMEFLGRSNKDNRSFDPRSKQAQADYLDYIDRKERYIRDQYRDREGRYPSSRSRDYYQQQRSHYEQDPYHREGQSRRSDRYDPYFDHRPPAGYSSYDSHQSRGDRDYYQGRQPTFEEREILAYERARYRQQQEAEARYRRQERYHASANQYSRGSDYYPSSRGTRESRGSARGRINTLDEYERVVSEKHQRRHEEALRREEAARRAQYHDYHNNSRYSEPDPRYSRLMREKYRQQHMYESGV